MSMNRREFMQILAAASAAGFALNSRELLAAQGGEKLYDLPRFGKFPTMNWYFVGRWRRGTPVGADDAATDAEAVEVQS